MHSPREGISAVLEQHCGFPKGCGHQQGPPARQASGTGLKWPLWELKWRKGEPDSPRSPRELWLGHCQSSCPWLLFRGRAAEIQPAGWLPGWQHLRANPCQPCGILLTLYGSSTDINYWQQNKAQKQHLFSLKTYLAILSFTASPVGFNFILTHRTTSTKGACLYFFLPFMWLYFPSNSVWL